MVKTIVIAQNLITLYYELIVNKLVLKSAAARF